MGKKRDRDGQILLLLADGFSEAQASLYISELREAGLPLKTLGLTRRLVRSKHGVEILPDLSLDAVIRTSPPIKLLILPGGKAVASAWRADPRTRLLFDLVQEQGGCLVVAPELVALLETFLDLDLAVQLCEDLPAARETSTPAMPILVARIRHGAAPQDFIQKLVKLFVK